MSRRTRVALAALLSLLALNHLGKGLYFLVVEQPASAIADLRNRRLETAYFLDRVSPQSQNFLYWSRADPSLARWAAGADPRSSHGEIYAGGLPPWSYPLDLLVFIPGPERLARVYLAGLDLLALAVLLWAADRILWRHRGDPLTRALTLLSVLAIGATNSTLSQGQYGLLVNAALAVVLLGMARPASRAWAVAAGVAMALAMAKPSSAVLIGVPLLARGRWVSIAVCGAILAGATLAGSWWVHIPVAMQLAQFQVATLAVIAQSANLLITGLAAISSPALARNLLGGLGLGLAIVATLRFGRRDLVALFAVLAVLMRLFTYHRAYDDVLLAFVMIALSRRAFAGEGSRRWQAIWLGTGLSLWLPYSLYLSRAGQVYQLCAWTAAGAVIWWSAEKCERGESNPQSLSATGS